MNLGENIYRLRTQKNMSQGDLADALEVSRQSVSKWENNSAVPELEKLMKMAQIFGVTLDALVSFENHTENSIPQQEPTVIYVEKPIRPSATPMQIVGIILLFCSALVICFSFLFEQFRDLEDCIPLCLPVALCGIFCLSSKKPTLGAVGSFLSATGCIYLYFPPVGNPSRSYWHLVSYWLLLLFPIPLLCTGRAKFMLNHGFGQFSPSCWPSVGSCYSSIWFLWIKEQFTQ